MRFRRPVSLLALIGLAACASRGAVASAPSAADAPVMAAVDSTLLALARTDTALMRRVLLPGATFTVTMAEGGGAPATVTDRQVLAQLAQDTEPVLERIWSPRIERHGRLAIVTAPYDFWMQRRFSHCGVDVFTVTESRGRWRVAAIAYTVQQEGCPPSPLGAPRW